MRIIGGDTERKTAPWLPQTRWFWEESVHAIPPPCGEVHIWTALFQRPHDEVSLRRCLSKKELLHEASFGTDELRHRFTVSHGRLRCVLARYLSCAPEDVKLVTMPYGKPCLLKGRLFFNMAHTDKRVMIVVSTDGPVGVDAEEIQQIPESRAIARRWFSTKENRWIESRHDERKAFLRCWVRREAFLKALGVGLNASGISFEFIPPPSPLVFQAGERTIHVQDMQPNRQYVCALASCRKSRRNENDV